MWECFYEISFIIISIILGLGYAIINWSLIWKINPIDELNKN